MPTHDLGRRRRGSRATMRATSAEPLGSAPRPGFVDRGQELGEQVAVRGVQLDDLEARLGRVDRRDAGSPRRSRRARRRSAAAAASARAASAPATGRPGGTTVSAPVVSRPRCTSWQAATRPRRGSPPPARPCPARASGRHASVVIRRRHVDSGATSPCRRPSASPRRRPPGGASTRRPRAAAARPRGGRARARCPRAGCAARSPARSNGRAARAVIAASAPGAAAPDGAR